VRALEEIVAVGPSDDTPKKNARRGPTMSAPRLAEIADRLSDRYDTRVKIDLGRTKGKVVIEFATIEDLERIVTLMEQG
jgi:ParB family chromosome partitioning protein